MMGLLFAANLELPFGLPNATQPVVVAIVEGQEYILMDVETAKKYAVAWEESKAYKQMLEIEQNYTAELEKRLHYAEIRGWLLPIAVALGFLAGAYVSLQR